jgi:hypothetical protein
VPEHLVFAKPIAFREMSCSKGQHATNVALSGR